MENVLRKDALTETFDDMEKLICDVVWKFIKKYGGNFEELKAEANFQFTLAFDSYKDSKAYFTTWLCYNIWKRLLDLQNNKKKHTNISLEEINIDQLVLKKKSFPRISEILEEVNLDSKIIIRLIFSPPEGLTEEDLEKGFGKRRTRAYIKEYLTTKLDWKDIRIKNAFKDISNAIQK